MRLGRGAGLDSSREEQIAARQGLLYSVHEFFIDRHADDAADNARPPP